jgi:type IV pilus assembly protein PilQ
VSLCCAPPVIGQDRSSDTAGRGTPADAADSSAVSGTQDNAAAPERSATPAQNATADTAGAPAAKDAQAREEKAAPAAAEENAAVVDPGNVTVNFKGADIKTVLAYISEVAGVDIVPAPDVKGLVDLKLTNKPWKTALDIIVRNYGFAYEREGDIIRVVTLDNLKQEELSTQAFNLNYSRAKDVVAALKNIIGDRGKVMYDERTNTVLVTDIPTNIYRTGEIIKRLDKKTEQILIEARIIETVLGKDEKMGIDWNIKISATGAKRPTTIPFDFFNIDNQNLDKMTPLSQTNAPTTVLSPGGQTTDVTPADFPLTALGAKGFPFAFKDDFTFGTLDFSEFKAVLELLKSRSDTETVSNPRIATLNNIPAIINVGDTISMPTFERNSTTGKMEITGYTEKNAGIILNVTPHVNDNGEIALELSPEITNFEGFKPIVPGSDIYAPLFNTRQAKTQVMIKDTQTIFIGGLISERDVERQNKLPFLGDMLGDVPYVGLLFSKKDTIKQRVELIFFITVNLMTQDKDIKDMPKANKAYVPIFTTTQKGDPNPKKRLTKGFEPLL